VNFFPWPDDDYDETIMLAWFDRLIGSDLSLKLGRPLHLQG
jgi:hypothetical protein